MTLEEHLEDIEHEQRLADYHKANREMKEALVALLAYAQAQGLTFTPGWGESVLNRARAAIAKVELRNLSEQIDAHRKATANVSVGEY